MTDEERIERMRRDEDQEAVDHGCALYDHEELIDGFSESEPDRVERLHDDVDEEAWCEGQEALFDGQE